MVCHMTLLKRGVKRESEDGGMGVSMTAADAEGIEELKKEKIVLLVNNKNGIGHSEWKERIQVSLCRAKIEATIRGHLR